jgi:hypothetical protein
MTLFRVVINKVVVQALAREDNKQAIAIKKAMEFIHRFFCV